MGILWVMANLLISRICSSSEPIDIFFRTSAPKCIPCRYFCLQLVRRNIAAAPAEAAKKNGRRDLFRHRLAEHNPGGNHTTTTVQGKSVTTLQGFLKRHERTSAISTNGRKNKIVIQSHAILHTGMTVRQHQLWMVEWCLLELNALVCQVHHEFNERRLISFISLQFRNSADVWIQILYVRILEICSASIELDNFQQILAAAVMETRPVSSMFRSVGVLKAPFTATRAPAGTLIFQHRDHSDAASSRTMDQTVDGMHPHRCLPQSDGPRCCRNLRHRMRFLEPSASAQLPHRR